MPLIINVSIAQQKVRIYDANGLFAEAPVSTGMAGHPTPMGVFSVIQKDRYHHSNIYSGAPMPYMQRITWGGVAMHEGVLPGYPASHGCIRMPRLLRGQDVGLDQDGRAGDRHPRRAAGPASFAHALLAATKVAPPPVVAPEPPAPRPTGRAEGQADQANLERARASATATRQARRSDADHRTADASAFEQRRHDDGCGPRRAARATSRSRPPTRPSTDTGKSAETNAEAQADAADAAKHEQRAGAEDRRGETSRGDARAGNRRAAASSGRSRDDAKPERTAGTDGKPKRVRPTQAPKTVSRPSRTSQAEPKPETPKAGRSSRSPRRRRPTVKPEPAKADVQSRDDAKRCQEGSDPHHRRRPRRRSSARRSAARSRSSSAARIPSSMCGRTFAPLFDVPVTIAPSDRPLGTHVFTAEVDKNDTNVLHWTVVTVPPSARAAMRDSDERAPLAASARASASAAGRGQAAAAAGQPGRGARPHHHPAGGDGAHLRGA